ncbi:hypothetical protein [Dactylosporangium sp. CA-139066]|uniref:hypothetical protein n=1 Tax=Dactylosporangium sp. CA-139066 TaxID=3239930 RepID=UPI003D8F7286
MTALRPTRARRSSAAMVALGTACAGALALPAAGLAATPGDSLPFASARCAAGS